MSATAALLFGKVVTVGLCNLTVGLCNLTVWLCNLAITPKPWAAVI